MKNILQKVGNALYNKLMKRNNKYKESEQARKDRLEFSGCTRTQVVKSKKVYNRKDKHKNKCWE